MKIIIFGGAGFIGSYLVEHFLGFQDTEKIIVYDNFSSGNHWHLESANLDERLEIIEADIASLATYEVEDKFDLVVMLAANPDIAKATIIPDIDFHEGTVLMNNVLEFMRINSLNRLIYASGSGVYGDVGERICDENYSPMLPISTYGASKLACEALISSYTHMFGLVASCFRFGNAVGGRQTHGVAYDFIRRLTSNPNELEILGDGEQSKPYVYIADIVSAIDVVLNNQNTAFEAFNVAPLDSITVTEIAKIVIQELGLNSSNVNIKYTGGDRGWKGDVPIVRLSSDKIIGYGWHCKHMSRDAIRMSVKKLIENIELFPNA